jgi:stearoyl-CoA desaturase (delta-9 desaturase)
VEKSVQRSDISDLKADPILKFQHTFFFPLAFFMGIILPSLIAGFGWGDFWGGMLIGGFLTITLIQHSTFCVNSVAHYFGDLTYSDTRSPRDAFWVSLLTFGEGYHNFHHEFPYDYRNGVNTFAWDPSKWLIKFFFLFWLGIQSPSFPRRIYPKRENSNATKKSGYSKIPMGLGPR